MYREQYRKAHGISTGRLETAVPVTPDTERRLKELIEAQTRGKLELEASVKPDLIGGFVFEISCAASSGSSPRRTGGSSERQRPEMLTKKIERYV